MAPPSKDESTTRKLRPPATTVASRERQLVALAVDLAEKQLSNGTASSQVITHYLKLGSERESLERSKLERENKLLDAKVEQIESGQRIEALYGDALNAMKSYAPTRVDE